MYDESKLCRCRDGAKVPEWNEDEGNGGRGRLISLPATASFKPGPPSAALLLVNTVLFGNSHYKWEAVGEGGIPSSRYSLQIFLVLSDCKALGSHSCESICPSWAQNSLNIAGNNLLCEKVIGIRDEQVCQSHLFCSCRDRNVLCTNTDLCRNHEYSKSFANRSVIVLPLHSWCFFPDTLIAFFILIPNDDDCISL